MLAHKSNPAKAGRWQLQPLVRRPPAPRCLNLIQSSARLDARRSEEHTSELQSHLNLVCRLLLEKKEHPSEIQALVHLGGRLLLPQHDTHPHHAQQSWHQSLSEAAACQRCCTVQSAAELSV